MQKITAVIADDEPVLRQQLKRLLAEQWPELIIVGEAGDGDEAVQLARKLQPDIAFLDIRMPGMTGIEAAAKINTLSLIVFVTAYNEYAIDAFEKQAVDYLLKPVDTKRLAKTISRLKESISNKPHLSDRVIADLFKRLEQTEAPAQQYLQWLKVSKGEGVRLLNIDEVYYFQAADKYTRVVCETGEELIRTSIKQLSISLDPERFWQIHRATIVNVESIKHASRSFTGRYRIHLKKNSDILTVSRTYGHLFKQM
ncbi:MAG TPA: response regulator transcription factor [Desulfocapsa sulfexigens]|nr:response regulator transcription factor [Desulfocapsa sulfexigens]